MFKKIYLFVSLLAATVAQANVHIAAHLDVSHNDQVTQVNFDKIIPKNHYAGITTFYSESGYRLGIRIVGISDTVVTVELFVEDADGKVIYNPTLGCTWDVSASTQFGTRDYENRVDELIALTITVSRKETDKNESNLQRLYNFVSKNKANIALGVASALGLSVCIYAMYDLFYISGPAGKKATADAQEWIRQSKIVIEELKKVGEITKDLPKTQQS